MKKPIKKEENKRKLREQIMRSMMASFKIEGINIPLESAVKSLEKIELKLGK